MWSAAALAAVRVIEVGLFLWLLRADPHQLRAMLHLAPWFLSSAGLILAGGAFDGPARTALWASALAVDFAGSLEASRYRWRVSASHFAERYQLFVIVALGESIFAIGVGAGADGQTAELALAIGVAFVGVCLVGLLRLGRARRGARPGPGSARGARTSRP
jgi:low temperature requirement protein LtrA